MDIKDLLKYNWWPIPTIDQIDRLQRQLTNLKEYFKEDTAIIKYNTLMYDKMKWPLTKYASTPSIVNTISKSLWDIVEDNI